MKADSHNHRAAPRRKIHHEDLGPGEVLCSHCPAKCCRYFALPIDTPTTWRDFDYIRWFLMHDRATVFNEDGSWYLLVHTACRHLREDNLCDTYATRPRICREYTTRNCEYEEDWVYDHYLETPEQVEEFAEAVLGPRPGQGFRSPRPPGGGAASQCELPLGSFRSAPVGR
ncbi:MAG: YkgJ family cysteine cluster protein [Thermoguttaceae bacterium]|jgi:Fe-S-cluster containining protein